VCTRKIPAEFSLGSFPFTNLDLANTTNHIQYRCTQLKKIDTSEKRHINIQRN
jgi:hypothetical protein